MLLFILNPCHLVQLFFGEFLCIDQERFFTMEERIIFHHL